MLATVSPSVHLLPVLLRLSGHSGYESPPCADNSKAIQQSGQYGMGKWTERNLPDDSSSSHAGLYLAGKVFPPVAAEKAGDSLRVLQSMRQDTASTFT